MDKPCSRAFVPFLVLLFSSAAHAGVEETRAAFLKVIDRPRVDLQPEERELESKDGLTRSRFTFAADASGRVPGLTVKQTAAPGRRPVVIVLHGTGGKKEAQLPLLETLAKKGFLAVAIDAPHHGERATQPGTKDYAAAVAQAYRDGKRHPFFYDTVWDLMRLIDYLETRPDVDPKRIGAVGFSKGGIELYLAAAVDERIAVSVPCIGVQGFGYALDHGLWQSRVETIQQAVNAIAAEEKADPADVAFVRRFYDRVAPGIHDTFDGPAMLPLVAPRPLLVVNGEKDPRTPMPGLRLCTDPAARAYEAADAADRFVLRIQPNTGHAVTPDSLDAAVAWFTRWLAPESDADPK